MKKTKWLLALCFASCIGYAQVIWTMAGTGSNGNTGNGGFAQSATFGQPHGVVVDGSGNTYIADFANSVVRKVDTKGIVTAYAGTGTAGYSGNGGAATSAQLDHPVGLAIDGSGNLYIADSYNYVIRKVTSGGIISNFAGNHTSGYSGDGGAATSAQLSGATGVAYESSTGNLYIADVLNFVIRKVTSGGTISTVAGTGTQGNTGNGGAATSAQLFSPHGIAVDGSGNLYISDNGAYVVRKFTDGGNINAFAGTGTSGYTGDGGAATSARINDVRNVACSGSDVYLADGNNYVVRKVSSGNISTYAGTGTNGNSGNGGAPTSANLSVMGDVAVDGSGNLYIADIGHIVHKVSSNCPAVAGPNKANTCGACCPSSTVSIGTPSIPNMTYAWTCSGTCNFASPGSSSAQTNAYPCSIGTPTTYTVTVSGSGCTTNTSTMTITSTTASPGCCRISGISNQDQDSGAFSIYPNPSSDEITIKLLDRAEYVQIMDITSKIVFEVKDVQNDETLVDVSKYAKGIYFVIAKVGGTIEKQKLVIE